MPWGETIQVGPHSTRKYWIPANEPKMVEVKGSMKINGWDLSFYANEWGKYEAIAYKPIKKNSHGASVWNSLEIKLDTNASIPKFIPIEKDNKSNRWERVIFCEVNDGNDNIVKEFHQYQEMEPHVRTWARSSIMLAYDFLKQYLPEFEDFIKNETVTKHASKIVEKAQKL